MRELILEFEDYKRNLNKLNPKLKMTIYDIKVKNI